MDNTPNTTNITDTSVINDMDDLSTVISDTHGSSVRRPRRNRAAGGTERQAGTASRPSGSAARPTGTGTSRTAARRTSKRSRVSRFSQGTMLAILGAGFLIGCIITFGVMKVQEHKKVDQAVEESLQGIKDSLSEGNTVLSTLRKTYTDDLIMYKDSRYVFLPVDRSLKMHSFKSENVEKLPGGEWQYKDNDKIVSRKGIDVSSHQGVIDWSKVAADGVEHAIIRAMYRGYGSGKLVEDTSFRANIDGALSNGLTTGVYVFTQAVSREEVEEEIEMLKSILEPYSIEGPVVVDVEQTAEGTGRMDTLDPEKRTELVRYFCELVREAGYHPMIYFNIETALLMLKIEELEDYDKWFATYNSDFYYPYKYSIWQYTDKGHVDGIDGSVDLDLVF